MRWSNPRGAAAGAGDTLQVLTNFEIGRLIVEHEQQGAAKAEYGDYVMRELAANLTAQLGKGFSKTNFEYMRRFFLTYQDRRAAIAQPLSGRLLRAGKTQPRSVKSSSAPIPQTPSGELQPIAQPVPVSETASRKFTLSWSAYVLLLGIRNPEERSFYEIEATQDNWSLSQLKRQVASSLYERLALSRDKKRIRKLAEQGHIIAEPADLLKEPLVLEFLGLDEKPGYSETDLESALIDKLQHFLLELGKGFLFEARQKRFTFDLTAVCNFPLT